MCRLLNAFRCCCCSTLLLGLLFPLLSPPATILTVLVVVPLPLSLLAPGPRLSSTSISPCSRCISPKMSAFVRFCSSGCSKSSSLLPSLRAALAFSARNLLWLYHTTPLQQQEQHTRQQQHAPVVSHTGSCEAIISPASLCLCSGQEAYKIIHACTPSAAGTCNILLDVAKCPTSQPAPETLKCYWN